MLRMAGPYAYGVFEMWSQCLPYEGEWDGGLVADGKLVVPGRDASGLLQQTDPALDLVSALVHLAVESGRAATGRPSTDPVAGLVALLRDGVRDPAFAQVGADLERGVGAIRKDVLRASARMSNAGPRDADLLHDPLENRCVAPLARGDDSRKDVAGSVHREVNLGGQPTTGAAETMVVRLGCQVVRTRPARIVSPFLRAPTACWCARQTVESTETPR